MLLEAAQGDRLDALYVLAVTTGMRRGELLGLKWTDVDLENGRLSIRRALTRTEDGKYVALAEPKTKGSRRTVKLTQSAVEALRSLLERQLAEIEERETSIETMVSCSPPRQERRSTPRI